MMFMQAKKSANWQVMEKAAGRAILDKLRPTDAKAMFSSQLSEVTRKELPFYTDFQLYRVTDYSTLPSFRLDYLGDGELFFLLDGTVDPIYATNLKEDLNLRQEQVPAYLRFFFAHAENALGEVKIIETAKDMPLAETLSAEQKAEFARRHQPLDMAKNEAEGGFTVAATLLYDGALVVGELFVRKNGQVSIRNHQLLLKNESIPITPQDYS